jgi:phage baseplate assembly protein W
MADLALQFGGDLGVNSTGDIALADGQTLTEQGVLRRLLTNPGDYIWQLSYGAGLGQFVGQPGAPAAINGTARAQILQEAAVAQTPAPSVGTTVSVDGTVTLTLRYADAANGQTNLLSFSV